LLGALSNLLEAVMTLTGISGITGIEKDKFLPLTCGKRQLLMKRQLFLVVLLSMFLALSGQEMRQYEYLIPVPGQRQDTLNHQSVRNLYPFLPSVQSLKSFQPFRPCKPDSAWYCRLFNRLFSQNLVTIRQPGYLILADPLFDLELGRETAGKTNTWVNTRGVQVYGKLELGKEEVKEKGGRRKEKNTLSASALGSLNPSLEFYTSYFESQTRFPLYLDSLASVSGGVPGQGFIKRNDNFWDNSYATAWVRYHARKYFTFELGTGKNFFGNGYRSLLLSDNSRNYPYFRIDTRFWRIHYTNLWAEFQDNRYHDGPLGAYQKKYGVFHYLSYSLTDRLELSLFEAIIWQGRDSLHNRGFDISYLNPVIFLRPVEWTLGSPDNALMGINLDYRLFDDTYLYSQILFDEFSVSHMKARDGYWGNKYGGQIGFKAWFSLENSEIKEKGERRKEKDFAYAIVPSGVFVQSEFNFARPYTYSHWISKQNYGHMGQPIAHPLGANFYEWVNFARIHWNRFIIEGRYSLARFGANYDTLNFGQDIFLSYDTHVNELGNFIGQGRATTLHYTSLTFSFLLSPSSLLNIFCTLADRREVTDSWNKHSLWFTFGLRSSVRNFYYDY